MAFTLNPQPFDYRTLLGLTGLGGGTPDWRQMTNGGFAGHTQAAQAPPRWREPGMPSFRLRGGVFDKGIGRVLGGLLPVAAMAAAPEFGVGFLGGAMQGWGNRRQQAFDQYKADADAWGTQAKLQQDAANAVADRGLKERQMGIDTDRNNINAFNTMMGAFNTLYNTSPELALSTYGAPLTEAAKRAKMEGFTLPQAAPQGDIGTAGKRKVDATVAVNGPLLADTRDAFNNDPNAGTWADRMRARARLAGEDYTGSEPGMEYQPGPYSIFRGRMADTVGQENTNTLQQYRMAIEGDPRYIASQQKRPGILNNLDVASTNLMNYRPTQMRQEFALRQQMEHEDARQAALRLALDQQRASQQAAYQQGMLGVARQNADTNAKRASQAATGKGGTDKVSIELGTYEKQLRGFARSLGVTVSSANQDKVIATMGHLMRKGAIDWKKDWRGDPSPALGIEIKDQGYVDRMLGSLRKPGAAAPPAPMSLDDAMRSILP